MEQLFKRVLTVGLLGTGLCFGQQKKEVGQFSESQSKKPPVALEFRLEVYDLPVLEVIEFLDKKETDAGLRNAVLQRAAKEEKRVVEILQCRISPDIAAVVEAICERIYPTEYEPPEGIYDVSEVNEEAEALMAEAAKKEEESSPLQAFVNQFVENATPTAFETRNTGLTVEVEITSGEQAQSSWQVKLAPELVVYAGDRTWMGGQVEMPFFNTWRCNQTFEVLNDEWALVSVSAIGDRETGTRLGEKRILFCKVRELVGENPKAVK